MSISKAKLQEKIEETEQYLEDINSEIYELDAIERKRIYDFLSKLAPIIEDRTFDTVRFVK